MITTKKNISDEEDIRVLIRDEIEGSGRTLYWLSKKMGISAPYMSQILNGSRRIGVTHLLRILEILKVQVVIGVDAPLMSNGQQHP